MGRFALGWCAFGFGLLLVATACGGDDAAGGTGGAGTGGAGTGGAGTGGAGTGGSGTGGAAGAAGSGGSVTKSIGTVKGTLTITQASTTGPNCSRTYDIDAVEDGSTPWQCPTCKTLYRGSEKENGSTCPAGDVLLTTSVGWASDGSFFWGRGMNPSVKLGSATEQAGTVTVTVNASVPQPPGDPITLTGSGTLTLGTKQDDPLHGWYASSKYACGWTKTNPAAYTGGYTPSAGDTLPDGVFTDPCGDKVRLHDLLGQYLVIQANQTGMGTCPPCQIGASAQKAFEDAMKALGIPTLVVSLLVPTFFEAQLIPTQDDLKAWLTATGTSGVALADRGYGPVVIGSLAPTPEGAFGYPSYLLVAPDGKILHAISGYPGPPDGPAWDVLKTRIQTAAGK